MRKSKRDLIKLAALCLGMAIVCAIVGLGSVAGGSLALGLFFTAWLLLLVYRDHLLSQGNSIRQVRADYQRPPELTSKGSRGLPTSFD